VTPRSEAFPQYDPVGPAGASLLATAFDVIATEVAPNAAAVDTGGVQRSTLDALADVGLLGTPLPPAQQREVSELLAGSDLSTWFCWVQHQTPLRIIEELSTGIETPAAVAIKESLLPPLRSGRSLAAIAFAHVRRPGPANPLAKREPGGWRLNGRLSWVTSWDIADIVMVMVQGDDDDQDRFVCCLLPGGRSTDVMAGVHPDAPLDLLAMSGTHTRPVVLDDVFVPLTKVGAVLHRAAWLARDRVTSSDASPAAFGVTRGALAELSAIAERRSDDDLRRLVDALVFECRWTRSRAYELADDGIDGRRIEERLRLRAASLDLVIRATTAVVVAQAGAAMLTGASAERRVREAMFLQVQAQTADSRLASIERQISRSGSVDLTSVSL
jgi:alkylation response protein AidB-like acyl-CoA dehydrogenase